MHADIISCIHFAYRGPNDVVTLFLFTNPPMGTLFAYLKITVKVFNVLYVNFIFGRRESDNDN